MKRETDLESVRRNRRAPHGRRERVGYAGSAGVLATPAGRAMWETTAAKSNPVIINPSPVRTCGRALEWLISCTTHQNMSVNDRSEFPMFGSLSGRHQGKPTSLAAKSKRNYSAL